MDMFADDDYVQRYPHNGDKKAYFPTVSTISSVDYGPIDSNHESSLFHITEMMMSLNSLTINDNHVT